jgi:hypothetical protein
VEYVLKKLEGPSIFQILAIFFIKIGLPLKTDVFVPPVAIQIVGAFDYPFQKVCDIEKHDQKLCLLSKVYPLVVD